MTVRLLQWDTDFFGIPIGRADSLSLPELAACSDFACIYVESETPLTDAGFDLRLTDRRVVLARQPGPAGDAPLVRAARDTDRSALGPMLDRLTPWSRFARDPGFGVGKARRMYDAWLDRSFREELVGVADGDDGVTGFVTVGDGEIGLIATAVDGAGVGTQLVTWAVDRGAIRVATQADNERAIGLYEACGFARMSETFVYHLWLNDNESHG